MSALMRTRHTEKATEIFVSLPVADDMTLSKAIRKQLAAMGHEVRLLNDEGEELLTFEEIFPEAHPGMILRGCRGRDEMTQKELAEKLGIAQTRVSEMESGTRSISVKMAKKLAEIFETSYKVFL
jgi:DNA-binding XRE family transcriptional regulator